MVGSIEYNARDGCEATESFASKPAQHSKCMMWQLDSSKKKLWQLDGIHVNKGAS
jgi:hypothetical protein